ncbi:MAG: hypothetical protein H6604_00960 [Flavobacteriales bacterium]|nr:hypothetical protein [Flavobacteriales bacterium]
MHRNKFVSYLINNIFWLSLLVCFIFYFLPFKPKTFGDGEYDEGARQLLDFFLNGFSGDVNVQKGILTVVYYAVPYSLVHYFKSEQLYYYSAIIFNVLVVSYAIKLLFKSFRILGLNTKTQFILLILTFAFPIQIYYAFGVASGSFIFFGSCLFVYALVLVNLKPVSKSYFLLALSIVIVMGVRPNLIPLSLLVVLYTVLFKHNLKHKILFILTFFILGGGIYTFEKKINIENKDFKEIIFRRQILWGRYELRDEPFNWVPQHGHKNKYKSIDYVNNLKKRRELDSICASDNLEPTKYYLNWVANDIIENPILTLRQYFLKFFQSQTFMISPLIQSNKSTTIKIIPHIYINVINYCIIFLAFCGIYRLYVDKKIYMLLCLASFWAWSILYVSVFHSEARYVFPTRPIILLLAGIYLNYYFLKKEKSRIQ